MLCSVNGCSNHEYSRTGLCNKHYIRMRRHGTTDPGVRPRGTLEERFLTKFSQGDQSKCWEWTGVRNNKGYGFLQEAGRGSGQVLAHRYSYSYFKGVIPTGLFVLHSCDNPPCVNPNHLRIGTQSENIIEAFAKGRKFLPHELKRRKECESTDKNPAPQG